MNAVVKARKFVIVMLIGAASIAVSAEQRRGEVVLVRPPSPPIKFVGSWRPAGSTTDTRVVGTVVDISQAPVSFARVQLRDLNSGSIVAEGETNPNGEYVFTVTEPGTFVVEMVLLNRRVIALSNAGSLARYQTLNTIIQLPGRWDAATSTMSMLVSPTAFFGYGSARSMTSSTLALAADSEIRPVDGGEPVSPQ